MGVKVQTSALYEASLRKLFPQGPYWDKQFADPSSDCSLFCKAKLDQFIRFRGRMADLQNESTISTATETLDDWERIITGSGTIGMDTESRRTLLLSQKAGSINIGAIKDIGLMFGVTINDVQFPFRPAFFGFSYFGIDQIASPVSFSVLFIYATQPDESLREQFEERLTLRLLANYIIYFVYGGA
jgi:hypothetical protein